MEEQRSAVSRRWWLWLALAVLGVQSILVGITLPFSGFFSNTSFWYIDHPYHLYQIELGRALFRQGLLVGYDPFFAGGHLGGVSFNASARVPVLMAQLLPDATPTRSIYAVYVAACAILAPLMTVWFAVQRRWSKTQTAMAAALGLAFWWCSAFRWYDTAGLVSFVFCCYFGVAYAAWLWRLCGRPDRLDRPGNASPGSTRPLPAFISLLAAGMVGAAGCWLHPLFAVIVVIVFVGFLIAERPSGTWLNLVVRGGVVALVVVLLNLPWLLAMASAPSIVADQPYQRSVGFTVFMTPLLGMWSGMGSFLNPLCLAVCGLSVWLIGRKRAATILPLLAASGLLMLFAAFGAAIPQLAGLQPNRFGAPGFLMLGLAAASVLGDTVFRLRAGGNRRLQVVAMVAGLLVVGYVGREMAREVSSTPGGHYGKVPPEMTEVPVAVSQIANWISANTTEDGRILFETSLARVHGEGHAAGMIALMTHREMIGGAYPFNQPAQSFWDHFGFGKPLSRLTQAEFATGLRHYNVGWIVAHSPELQRYVAASGAATLAVSFGRIQIFKLERALSFVEKGQARVVKRDFNRIQLADVTSADLVLRYNWVPGLKATAPARIEPITVDPALPPMVRVLDAPREFVLSTCAACLK